MNAIDLQFEVNYYGSRLESNDPDSLFFKILSRKFKQNEVKWKSWCNLEGRGRKGSFMLITLDYNTKVFQNDQSFMDDLNVRMDYIIGFVRC